MAWVLESGDAETAACAQGAETNTRRAAGSPGLSIRYDATKKALANDTGEERRKGGESTAVDFLKRYLPANVGRYLQGIEFPIRKEELIGKLESNGVPGAAVGQIRKRLPEGEYRGPQEVLDALRRGGRP